ncbi:putative ribonuclease H-like domain-containing protein [Tanacetum coccineum]
MVPRAVLMKSGLVSVNTARQVNAAHSKTTVNAARPKSHFSKPAHSTIKRPIHKNTPFKNSNFNQRVNTVKDKNVNTVRLKVDNAQVDLQDQGVIDSGFSRHMIENMSYLTDHVEIDGGYVAFRGNPKGWKITKLGHLNFKTMNKLVKGNLVRGLPSKLFENDQTCVACQKGKQHRASCKSKTENSISLPLHLLHMDLFGLTFVKSLMKKMYCLVVTDDYSRFTWVFFLATKDETSGILKSFITGIENLVDHKVKVIRCDNGTEFKNREMNQFCEKKGILRQYSVARTPQQNGVAKRRNKTLIEAARTMLADSKLPTTFWAEAVNTACYVQNRVLVVKPYNKTPYELFHGTQFLTVLQDPKSSQDDGSKPLSDDEKKVDEDPRKDSESINQEKDDNVNSTNNVNDASTNEVNAVGGKISIEFSDDPNMSAFEDIRIFDLSIDNEDVGAEADMNNLDTTIQGKWKKRCLCSHTPGFKDPDFPDRVYKVEKTLYGLHQAPRAWTIIFGSTKKELSIEFEKLMHGKFHMSSMGEDEDGEEVDVHMYRSMIGSLMYLTSLRPDVMFAVCAYARYQVNPKVLHLHVVKRIFSDYAGASLRYERYKKEFCLSWYLGLLSWLCMKQTSGVYKFHKEAEYVAASKLPRVDKCFGFRINYLIMGKAKKSFKLMMEKLFRMELELMLFWSTVKAKTINEEVQLHALVDGKKIIIIESTVRRDLQLEDAKGVDCLPNSTIFE